MGFEGPGTLTIMIVPKKWSYALPSPYYKKKTLNLTLVWASAWFIFIFGNFYNVIRLCHRLRHWGAPRKGGRARGINTCL